MQISGISTNYETYYDCPMYETRLLLNLLLTVKTSYFKVKITFLRLPIRKKMRNCFKDLVNLIEEQKSFN